MERGSRAAVSGLSSEDATPSLSFPSPQEVLLLLKRGIKMSLIPYQAHIYIWMYLYNHKKNHQETGQFLISHLEDILTQLCSCIFTFLFGFLWLSNIQKEQAVIRLLGQQTSEKQKMPCRHILDSAVENTAFPPIFYSLKQLFSQSINPSTIFK